MERGSWRGRWLADGSLCFSYRLSQALYRHFGGGKGHFVDLMMVVPTLLGIGRVTLAEAVEFGGHRTSTNNLGSAFIGALK